MWPDNPIDEWRMIFRVLFMRRTVGAILLGWTLSRLGVDVDTCWLAGASAWFLFPK